MKTHNFLEEIMARKKNEVYELLLSFKNFKGHPMLKALNSSQKKSGRFFERALKSPKLSIIGEIKRKSPSKGEINNDFDLVERALSYCRAGASAISILTDKEGFGGTLEDLRKVSSEVRKKYPDMVFLRKDFIFHSAQLVESVYFGATAVLLIVAVVGSRLKALLEESARLGLETLVEVHSQKELEIAQKAGASIIGVNHRDLKTFAMDLTLSQKLKPMITPTILTVAESGIDTVSKALEMHKLGYNSILVGEALMKSKNPERLIQNMRKNNES